jgi:hypothetical protein
MHGEDPVDLQFALLAFIPLRFILQAATLCLAVAAAQVVPVIMQELLATQNTTAGADRNGEFLPRLYVTF